MLPRKAAEVTVMSRGGARNRSGPAPDPNSGRSEARGLSLTALPNEGYSGEVPEFPLSDPAPRELEVWDWLWSLPQAAMWALDKWRWLQIANLARLQARSEVPDAPAALATNIRQLHADLGLSPAGMIENGWQIAYSEIPSAGDGGSGRRASSRDRMKARVSGG